MRRVSGKGNKRRKTEEPDVKVEADEVEENGEEKQEEVEERAEVSEPEGGSDSEAEPDKKSKKKKGKKGRSSTTKKSIKKEKEAESEEEDGEEYEVESIVDSRYMRGKRQFKVRWRGHGPEEDSWCGEADLHCPELIQEYLDTEGGDEAEASTSKKKQGKKRKSAAKKNDNDDSDAEKEYEVERVLEVKFKKNGAREFLVRWKGYSANEDTWEPESNLSCTELINKLMAKVDKAKELSERELRAKPKKTSRLMVNNPQIRTSRRMPKGGRISYHDLLD